MCYNDEKGGIGMKYEKLPKGALGCMYTATGIGTLFGFGLILGLNYFWFIPTRIQIWGMYSI